MLSVSFIAMRPNVCKFYDADLSEKDISEEVLKSCYIFTYGKDKNGAHSGNMLCEA